MNSNQEEEGSEIVQTSPGSYQLPANVHLLTLAIIPETEQVRILNLMKISILFFLQELNGIVDNCYICLIYLLFICRSVKQISRLEKRK